MKLSLPFSSERRFLVVSYSLSHGLLLLRSNKPDKQSLRIDILFGDVRAAELRFWFDGITIEEVDMTYLRDYDSRPVEMMEHGNRVYALKGRGWNGFIVGGGVLYNEDDKINTAPSALIGE